MIVAPDVTNFTYILENTVSSKYMNNKTNLAIAFLLAGTLLSGTTAMAPVFAENDDDDKRHDNDKRHDKGGDGNKQKVEDGSVGIINDCDKNEVERADFECIANGATEDSEINERDGDGDGDGGLFPVNGECQGALVEVVIDGITICVPPGQVPSA
jgi:hypothetical protein